MENLLVALFAVVDAELWSVATLVEWVDARISEREDSPSWLLELSLCKTSETAEACLSRALVDAQRMLPEDYGDLLAGCIVLRGERVGVTKPDLVGQLFDVCDSYDGVGGLEVSQLGALLEAGDDAIANAWPELDAALMPLRSRAEREDQRLLEPTGSVD
ncbi:MAG: hypothetical protein AAF799_32510 [Myxococcota bacterium]